MSAMLAVDVRGEIAMFESRPRSAAHSMDTDWYAVDAAGRVAILESGEEGAVPWEAHRQYWDELIGDVAACWIAREHPEPFSESAKLQRALTSAADPTERALISAILADDRPSRAVYADWLECRGRDPLGWNAAPTLYALYGGMHAVTPGDLPARWSGVIRFAADEWRAMYLADQAHLDPRALDPELGLSLALSVADIEPWVFDPYWDAGAIAAAYVLDNERMSANDLGLYRYACGFSGPYSRRSVPATPLRIEDLPGALRARLARLTLSRISFDRADRLDPETFAPCQRYRE